MAERTTRLDVAPKGGVYLVKGRRVNANGVPLADAAPANDTPSEAELARAELRKMPLDDLKALAIEAGADADAVAKMRAKDEVIDALEAEVDLAETLAGQEDD